MFNFLRQCQTVFYSSSVILHPHQPWTRVKFIHMLISICYFFSLKKKWEYEVVSCFDLHFPNDK